MINVLKPLECLTSSQASATVETANFISAMLSAQQSLSWIDSSRIGRAFIDANVATN